MHFSVESYFRKFCNNSMKKEFDSEPMYNKKISEGKNKILQS